MPTPASELMVKAERYRRLADIFADHPAAPEMRALANELEFSGRCSRERPGPTAEEYLRNAARLTDHGLLAIKLIPMPARSGYKWSKMVSPGPWPSMASLGSDRSRTDHERQTNGIEPPAFLGNGCKMPVS